MINVLIADDMKEYRNHFRMMLENERDIKVLAAASGEEDVIEKANELHPDVILMDIQMDNDRSGIIAAGEIIKKNPDIKIIMLSIHSSKENIIDSYEAGAIDFIEKTAPVYEIITAIRSAVAKDSPSNRINHVVIDELIKLKGERNSFLFMVTRLSTLSKTEMEILKAVAAGYKYREIAEQRCVEEVTIRAAASKICHKTGIRPIKEVIDTIKRLNLTDLFNNITDGR